MHAFKDKVSGNSNEDQKIAIVKMEDIKIIDMFYITYMHVMHIRYCIGTRSTIYRCKIKYLKVLEVNKQKIQVEKDR